MKRRGRRKLRGWLHPNISTDRKLADACGAHASSHEISLISVKRGLIWVDRSSCYCKTDEHLTTCIGCFTIVQDPCATKLRYDTCSCPQNTLHKVRPCNNMGLALLPMDLSHNLYIGCRQMSRQVSCDVTLYVKAMINHLIGGRRESWPHQTRPARSTRESFHNGGLAHWNRYALHMFFTSISSNVFASHPYSPVIHAIDPDIFKTFFILSQCPRQSAQTFPSTYPYPALQHP